MKNCVNVFNNHTFSKKSPPSHKAVICLVTYSDKIALENKDGFLWPLTSCITENECPLTKALVMLQQQGNFTAESIKHNITSLGQTTSNATITLIFRLNISKICSPRKLMFSEHSKLQWYKTKHFLASPFNQDSIIARPVRIGHWNNQ